jgi:hypothetical protein
VQRDELAETPESRRAQLLAVHDRLVMTHVATEAAIWDVSKWGHAKFGDGAGGPSTLRIGDIMTTNPKDAQDALIAVTTGAAVDILVTDERTLPKRIQRNTDRPEVLTFAQFMERMRALG